jgi:beta-glucosidase
MENPLRKDGGDMEKVYETRAILRGTYAFNGVVCTDWGITKDGAAVDSFGTTPWGAETLTTAERHYRILMAGVDQFGGNNDAGPVLEAYEMGVRAHGEPANRARMEQSAVRLLRNMFRTGLFENPYLDIAETRSTVGNAEFMRDGYAAQLKSVVRLKNRAQTLPVRNKKTVYVPKRSAQARKDFFGNETPDLLAYPINPEIVKKYFPVPGLRSLRACSPCRCRRTWRQWRRSRKTFRSTSTATEMRTATSTISVTA